MVTFKFKTRYGYTSVIVEFPRNDRIKFKLSPLKNFRNFPIDVFAEYNKTLLNKQHKASVLLTCDSPFLSAFEMIKLKEKAKDLLPVPPQAIDLLFERISKGDYSVVR